MAETVGVDVVEVLFGEGVVGLDGVALIWEMSSGVMLMVLGGDVSRVGEVVVD